MYSDSAGTAQANPFTASNAGRWFFYADGGNYDVRFSAGGIATPFTLSDFRIANDVFDVTDFGAKCDGTTNDYTAVNNARIAATAQTNGGTVLIPSNVSGVCLINSSITFDADVTLAFEGGGVISMASATTATINGKSTGPPVRRFAGVGNILFGNNSIEAIYPEWWYDGGGNWHDAILDAMNSVPQDTTGVPIRFGVTRAYPIASSITVPDDGSNSRAIVLEGIGGGTASYKTSLQFSELGAAVDHLSFPRGSQVTIRNLQLEHSGGTPTSTNHGTGLLLTGSTYVRLEDLWITSFDVGLELTGNSFYGRMDGVRTIANYTYGMWLNNALMNGTPIYNSQFSNTINGDGLFVTANLGATFTIRSSWFEGNSRYGLYSVSAQNTIVDSCYFEANGDYDIFMPNTFSEISALLTLTNSYFDFDTAENHVRIRLDETRAYMEGNRFWRSSTSPPITVSSVKGTRPSIAINNEYYSTTFTDVTDDAGWTIIDTKHPTVRFASASPEGYPSMKVGDTWINTTAASGTYGWVTTAPGRSASVTDPAGVTAATTATSLSVTFSSTAHGFFSGDYIQIAGVDFGGSAAAYAQIIAIESSTTARLDLVANQTVAAGAATYQVGTLLTIPNIYNSTGTGTINPDQVEATTRIGAGIMTNETGRGYIGVDDGTNGAFYIDAAVGNSGGPQYFCRKARGSQAARADAANGDYSCTIDVRNYSGGAYRTGPIIYARVDGTFVSGQNPPSRWEFLTNAANGSETLALTLESDQHLRSGATVSVATFTGATASTVCYDATAAIANTLATCTSLEELKDISGPLDLSALETIRKLRPIEFRYRPSSDRVALEDQPFIYGLGARQVNSVDSKLSTFYEGKLNGVDYNGVTALLIKAVQELSDRVDRQELEIQSLKSRR